MTRINFGIEPRELCDQHLIAEYKELPRAFAYVGRTLPGPFRLGTGHVIWCAQYPGTHADRYRGLVSEMQHRGFRVRYPEPRGDGARASTAQLAVARPIVRERIVLRLSTMQAAPRWAKREPPGWALSGRVAKAI